MTTWRKRSKVHLGTGAIEIDREHCRSCEHYLFGSDQARSAYLTLIMFQPVRPACLLSSTLFRRSASFSNYRLIFSCGVKLNRKMMTFLTTMKGVVSVWIVNRECGADLRDLSDIQWTNEIGLREARYICGWRRVVKDRRWVRLVFIKRGNRLTAAAPKFLSLF